MSESREQRLEAILHAYLQAVDRGEKPDRQKVLDAHPDLHAELAEYFAHASKLDRMARSLKTASFRGDGPRSSQGFEPPTPEELAARFPHLEILELLGKGGMGAVYKARHKGLDRLVAVKILPPEVGRDGAFADRFTREARALAKLNHPNIVAVYDFGQTEGLFFFVMEFVDGVNLRQALRTGTMTPKEALVIVPQICDALQFAHDEGIVHRDIKPENILIDKKGRVKIADFGLAKLLGQNDNDAALTGTHQVMGTLRYMAPEQMEGSKQVDHRADIYSLGVVFYELLTGELPMGRFAPPSKKVQIDIRLDEVVLRALEKEPEQRWQQASDVKTEMEVISRSEKRIVTPKVNSEQTPATDTVLSISPVRYRLFAFFAILLLNGAAFSLPSITRNGRVYRGWEWVAGPGEALPASAHANLFFWVGLVVLAFGLWRCALALGFTALMLVATDHAPSDSTRTYLEGLWLWLGSLMLLPAAAIFGWHKFGKARPLLVLGVVFVLSMALLIRGIVMHYDGPFIQPEAKFALLATVVLNLSLAIWAFTNTIRASLQADLSPERRVRGQALAMLIFGSLGCALGLAVGVVAGVVMLVGRNSMTILLFVVIYSIACFVSRLLTIYGGIKLLGLRSRGWGIASSVLMVLPTDPLALIGIPLGIWSLLTLLREDVTQAMEIERPGTPLPLSSVSFWHIVTWPLRNTAIRIALWSLLCVGLYVWLWLPVYPPASGQYPSHPWGLIDREYWPYRGELQATVTLIPKVKTFRQLTITNDRKIERRGWENGRSYWWGGPGGRSERTLDKFTVEVIDRKGQKAASTLEIDGVKSLDWRFTSGDKIRRGTTPFNVEDAIEWLKECNVAIDDEKKLREQTKSWVEIILHATSHSGNVIFWKGPRQPVGHLAYIVGQDLNTYENAADRVRGTVFPNPVPTFPWEDYIGTETIHYGPVVHILYVGVPLMLAVWFVGLLAIKLVSRKQSATSQRTWAEWWRSLPSGARLVVHVPLVLLYLYCAWCFFGYSGSSSTMPGDPAKSVFYFAIGQPSPWFERHSEATRSSTSIHFMAWSNLAAILGLLALWAMRRLEYLERGKVHSIRWHYGLWIFLLFIAVGIGVSSAIMHANKLAREKTQSPGEKRTNWSTITTMRVGERGKGTQLIGSTSKQLTGRQ